MSLRIIPAWLYGSARSRGWFNGTMALVFVSYITPQASQFICTSQVWADSEILSHQDPIAPEQTLEQCLQLLEQQPIYKRARLEELGQHELSLNLLSAYRPNIELDLFSGWRRPNISFTNPTGSNETLQAGATLSQFIYGFGLRRIAHSVVGASQRASELQRQETQNNLKWQLRQRFSQHLFLEQQFKTGQAAVTLSKTEMDIAQASFNTGATSELVFRQAKQNWLKAKSALIAYQNACDSSMDGLKNLLGKNIKPKGVLGERSHQRDILKDLHLETSSTALDGALSVRLLKELISKHTLLSKGYKTSRLPTLHGILNAERYGNEWHDTEHDWKAGLQLHWTIDSQSSARRQASSESYQAQTLQEDLRQLRSERQSLHELMVKMAKQLEQQQELQAENLEEAKELLDITSNLFKTGSIAYPRVEEARFQWITAQLDLNKTLLDLDLNHHRYLRWLE